MFKSNPDYDAETYFASINSMAKRIVSETSALQSAQAEKWKNLKYSEQHDLITQNFTKPALTEKYPNISSSPDHICFPKMTVVSGQKFVFEEDNANRRAGKSWRDEHSAPFMWESQSQLNLSYILQEVPAETPNDEETKSEEIPATEITEASNSDSQQVKTQNFKTKDEVPKRSHSKKKAAPPIPIPVPVSCQKEDSEQMKRNPKIDNLHSPVSANPLDDSYDEAGIPKTGFDFLDNW